MTEVRNIGAIAAYTGGWVDEFRISAVQRTPEWIKACFDNQSAPPAFVQWGAEMPKP